MNKQIKNSTLIKLLGSTISYYFSTFALFCKKKPKNQIPNPKVLYLRLGVGCWDLGFCGSAALGVFIIVSSALASPFSEHFDLALEEAGQKNYSEAIEHLKKQIADDSSFVEAYLRLADFYRYGDTLARGITFFQKSIQQHPENPYFYMGLAHLYKHADDWSNVYKNSRTSLSKGAASPYLMDILVQSALQQKKTNQLARSLSKIRTDPTRGSFYDLGYAIWRYRINNIKKARSTILSYLEKNEDFYGYKVFGDIERKANNFEKSTQNYQTALKLNKGELINIYVDILEKIAANFQTSDEPDSAYFYFTSALDLAQRTAARKEQLEVAKSLVPFYLQLGFFQKMADACHEGIEAAEELDEGRDLANLYHSLAFAYEKMADAERALKYYRLTIQALEKNPDKNLEAKTYSALGRIYMALNDLEHALEYLERGSGLAKRAGYAGIQYAALLKKGDLYKLLGKTEEAKTAYRKALRYAQRTQQHSLTETCFMKLANLYLQPETRDLKSAKYYFTLANTLARQTFQLQFAANHRWMQGKIALMEDDVEKAEMFFQEAIQLGKESGSYLSLIAGQSGLVKTYMAANIRELSAAYSDSVLNSLDQFFECLKEENTFEFFDLRKDLFLPAVTAYSAIGDLEKIYRVTEQYKAIKHNLALSAAKFKIRSAMVDSIKWKVDLKNRQISAKWQALWKSWKKDRSDQLELVMKNKKEIDELVQEKDWELTRIKQKYADTYQIFMPTVETLPDLQTELQRLNATFVHYLVGENATFITVVKPDGLHCKRVNRTANFIDSLITEISPLLDTNPTRQSSFPVEMNPFRLDYAGKAYELIFEPIRNWLPRGGLVIISRDGVLNRLPFESLVTNHTELPDHYDYNRAKFLVEEMVISYVPYAKFLSLPTLQNKETQKSLLAFANSESLRHNIPGGYRSSNGNVNLDEKYLKAVSNPFGRPETRVYSGKTATKDRFLEQAAKYKIIHLQLPRVLNERSPLYSRIHLAPSLESESYLETAEIFDLKLSADLVVLTGKERRLENSAQSVCTGGYLHGFHFAGVPSVVTTCWNWDGADNPKLLEDFYLNLKLGLGKAEALQKAKLDYLKEVSRNPLEWAPYILNGNSGRINFKSNSKYWIVYITLLGVAIFITVVVWQFLQMKKTSSSSDERMSEERVM